MKGKSQTNVKQLLEKVEKAEKAEKRPVNSITDIHKNMSGEQEIFDVENKQFDNSSDGQLSNQVASGTSSGIKEINIETYKVNTIDQVSLEQVNSGKDSNKDSFRQQLQSF